MSGVSPSAPAAPAYRVDSRPVPREAFYAVACDPRRSVVVEACAGAGKTWMLVSRILRALLDGAEPSQILAITFTRKAAGEMRQRLDEWLHQFATPNAGEAERRQALVDRGLSADAAAALAPALGALQGQVLAQARRVEIRTFHGWFGQLLAQAPMELLASMGLEPGLALIEDPTALRDELLRAFHRAVQADPALREDYLTLVRRHRRHAVMAWLDAAWQRRTEVEAAARAGTLADGVPAASAVFADCAPGVHPLEATRDPTWRAELQALATALGARGKAMSDKAALALQEALALDAPRRCFEAAWAALFTAGGTPRKQLGDLPAQTRACDALRALRERVRQQDAHDDHQRMARLSQALLGAYAALKRARALADMGDLEAVALALLSDGELAGWVQSRLDNRLRHLLIDEFQDTSPLQWHALQGWLAGYGGAGGGASALSVFIVGDPKQSIYRFRRAEPRVFAAAREFVAQGLGGAVLECDHTRRNAPAVIAALNAVFGDARDGDGWSGFRPHTTASRQAGAVHALPDAAPDDLPEDDASSAGEAAGRRWRDSLVEARHEVEAQRRLPEARHAAAAIQELIERGIAPGEVMVLARRRSSLVLLAQALAERQLPFVVPETLSIAQAPEALDLLALLDVLASPGHDLSLARVLRSPLFGAADADLLWLAQEAATAGSWWQALMQEARPAPTPALLEARRQLGRWAEAAARLPPHDLLDRIVHEGDVLARYAAALPPPRRRAGLQALQALLAAALELGGGRYVTPYGFVRSLRRDDVQARLPPPADAVRLLTVHGAKGLEARWVLVLDADPTLRKPERSTLLVDWPPDAAAPTRVAFVAREGAVAPSLQGLLDAEQAARRREELNGLYVAMTRAAEGLVFSRTETRGADPRSWWARVAPLLLPWTPAPKDGAATVSDAIRVPMLPGLQRPLATPLPAHGPEAAAAPAVDAAAARVGQAVHRMLEWIGNPQSPLARADWPVAARAAAAAMGAAAEAPRVLAVATRVVDSPDCARFFGGETLEWAGNEVPLAWQGELLRIDRLVLLHEGGARRWWVLDYKLGEDPGRVDSHRAQMARYLAAVQAAQPGAEVRGAFIGGQGRLVAM